ncbi:MAG: hypothetical protein IT462_16340 [Planctomycetes bacterium]|nr:hypothetical protein [Planctomycetota bacterium]
MRRKLGPWIALVAAIAFMAVAGWFLQGPRPAPRLESGSEQSSERPREQLKPQGQLINKSEQIAGNVSPTSVEKEPPSAIPGLEFVDDDPLVAQGPTYCADYKSLVYGRASAIFFLVDAAGKKLRGDHSICAWLTREMGRFGIEVPMMWDNDASTLFALGEDGFGMEVGSYTLRIFSEQYGDFEDHFFLSRGQSLERKIRLPRYRRVICFSFIDQNDKPVPALSLSHYVRYEDDWYRRMAEIPRSKIPRDALLSVGAETQYAPTCRSGRARPSEATEPGQYPTEGGRYYVEVFPGTVQTVRFRLLKEMYGVSAAEFRDYFLTETWDITEVRLWLAPDFAEQLKKLPEVWGFVAGNAIVTTAEPRKYDDGILDESTIPPKMCRIIVTAKAPVHVWPTLGYSSSDQTKPTRIEPAFTYSRQFSCWWTDVDETGYHNDPAQPGQYLLTLTDGLLFAASELVERGDARLVRIARTFKGNLLFVVPPSPTTAALATRVDAKLALKTPKATKGISRSGARTIGRSYLKTFMTTEQIQTLGEAEIDGHAIFRLGLHVATRVNVPLSWTAGEREKFVAGDVTLNPPGEGLVFRAVGTWSEGLPWVYATLLEQTSDAETKIIRRWLIDYPEKVAKLAAEKKLGSWFEEHGVWYNSKTSFRSDDHGFMTHRPPLVPGKRYVLYLWSNSRDELRPDRRIDFVAGQGITDLGAVMLPGYEK